MIFLDHSATTPTDPVVLDAMARLAAQAWGNPSSVHALGRRARAALEQARAELAACLAAPAEEVVFTASGSEANNLLIQGILARHAGRPTHLVVSAIEHDSVLNTARYLARRHPWLALTEVLPDPTGRVNPQAVAAALRPETCLVCLMHANNETGRLQPVAEVAPLVHEAGALLHVDAVQSFGRVLVQLPALGCDSLALAAHKFYGPKGVGALALRRGLKLDPLIVGGAQEHHRRAGTENLPGAAGMALAARLAMDRLQDHRRCLLSLESAFLEPLRAAGLPLQINGAMDDKLPGVLNLAICGIRQDDLVVGMDLSGYAIAAGSACSSGVIEPSHVLRAMGLPPWRVHGAIRVSFGRDNTPQEARQAAQALILLSQRLRNEIPSEEAL